MFLSPQVRQVIFFTRAYEPVVAANPVTGLQECNRLNSLIALRIPHNSPEPAYSFSSGASAAIKINQTITIIYIQKPSMARMLPTLKGVVVFSREGFFAVAPRLEPSSHAERWVSFISSSRAAQN
jgi:hypothetical protein